MLTHTTSGPVTIFCWQRPWVFSLCTLNAGLDLETLPQMSQEWETPVIWFASMWFGMFLYGPSFPQMLQVALNPFPGPADTSLLVIIDLICSSRSWRSTFFLSFVRATAVSNDPFDDGLSKFESAKNVGLFSFFRGTLLLCKVSLAGSFSASVPPVRPFSLNYSAKARNESRFSWKTFASPW